MTSRENVKPINVLLIEDLFADAKVIQDILADSESGSFHVEWVRQLSEGIDQLRSKHIDAVLLDLFLADSKGIATFDKIFQVAPHIPILVLSHIDEEVVAKQTVRQGAQDYLSKHHLDSYSLPRAIRNLLDQKLANEALLVERERAQVTLNSIGDAVLSTDVVGNVTYLNLAAEKLTGWSKIDASGRPVTDVFHIIDGETRELAQNPMSLAVQENKAIGLTPNCILIRRNGVEFAIEDTAAPIHDWTGRVIGAVIVFRDVTEARAISQEMIRKAQYDCLTDLPNRLLLNDRLMQAIGVVRRYNKKLAVLFLDLDHFKRVNDTLGHLIGDKLLQAVAKRLVTCIRNTDTVSRQGGDEFLILLSEANHIQHAASIAEKIITALAVPYSIDQHEIYITASIGISIYPNDGLDAENLYKAADTAMYHAKASGRNNYRFFEQDMNLRVMEAQSLEGNLRHALQRDEFILLYQPKINLETGLITGVEALIRWKHPSCGLLLPEQFVDIAEASGLIQPIGRWVLREACRQAKVWLDEGLPAITMAINVSAVEFHDKRFLEEIKIILNQTGYTPANLALELTETVLMKDTEVTAWMLLALKKMDVKLAIDDFGIGYSSLAYLKRLPVDILKIDQSFIRDSIDDPNSSTIVSALIGMGKNLNYSVIAEGIETAEQLAFLQHQGCVEGQGYFFSQPVVANEIAKMLSNGISRGS